MRDPNARVQGESLAARVGKDSYGQLQCVAVRAAKVEAALSAVLAACGAPCRGSRRGSTGVSPAATSRLVPVVPRRLDPALPAELQPCPAHGMCPNGWTQLFPHSCILPQLTLWPSASGLGPAVLGRAVLEYPATPDRAVQIPLCQLCQSKLE